MGIRINYTKGQLINNCEYLSDSQNMGNRRAANFKCKCGKIFISTIDHVKSGHTTSCGCFHYTKLLNSNITHGMSKTPEHRAWTSIQTRCYNPKFKDFSTYGGRGIKVCDRWLESFENFYADMGERPSTKHSIDRFPDVNGDYSPENCRWATAKEQANNKNNNIIIEYKGIKKTLTQWSEQLKISHSSLSSRLKKWSIEKSFETPLKLIA